MNRRPLPRPLSTVRFGQAVLFLSAGVQLWATPPELGVRTQGPQLELAWPASHLGFRVETTAVGLDKPDWQPIQEAATKVDGQYRLKLPQDSAMGFFRLVQVADAGVDQPGDFADTNGDGIDGDFSQAIFLAPPPYGDDQNPGTAESPVATLEMAVELAETVPLRHDVYIAQGTYRLATPLHLPPGVSLYGEFDGPPNWGRAVQNRAVIRGPSTTLVLGDSQGAGFPTGEVHLVGIDVIAADAGVFGGSSYAIIVRNLPDGVRIEDCRITAGHGAPGSPGIGGIDGLGGGDGTKGASGAAGGVGGTGGLRPGGAAGGVGGTGGLGAVGADGGSGAGDAGGLGGDGGEVGTRCRRGGSGLNGIPGTTGDPGHHGAAADLWGGLTETGYLPLNGGNGLAGAPGGGGGGGGGGGSNFSGSDLDCPGDQAGGGGGGGGGGVPGTPGQGGHGGGSSVAVYSFASMVTILNCDLVTGHGGAGGRGGNGGNGGPGGSAGANGELNNFGSFGGNGAPGGRGGAAGAGAGGPGGHSFGLLFNRDDTLNDYGQGNRYVIGPPGLGGPGGSNAVLGSAPPGRGGLSLPVGSR